MKQSSIKIISLIALLVAIVTIGFVLLPGLDSKTQPKPGAIPQTPSAESGDGVSTFNSDAYQFGFAFPKRYFVNATEQDASTTPHLLVVMLRDTKENRDLISGKITEPREGPTGITVSAYPNPKQLSPFEWAQSDVNWNVSDKQLATTTVSGREGAIFRWSGLYEGASVLVSSKEYMYVFAVSWESSDDPILSDFDLVLSSLRFGSVE